MAQATRLRKASELPSQTEAHSVVKLLMADHKLLRTLMKKVKSHKGTPASQSKAFRELEKSVSSHVKAEENTFLKVVIENPRFEHIAFEAYEEHRVHENILAGINRVTDKKRRIQQMHIFCEILEQHLDEEEEELFPQFKKYAALSTRQKIGKNYLEVRKKSNKTSKKRGAVRFTTPSRKK